MVQAGEDPCLRLIAAAPDMLAALKAVLQHIDAGASQSAKLREIVTAGIKGCAGGFGNHYTAAAPP